MFHFTRYVVKRASTREFFPGPIPKRKQPQRHKYLAQIAIVKSFDCEGNNMLTFCCSSEKFFFNSSIGNNRNKSLSLYMRVSVFSDEFNMHSSLKTLRLKTLTRKNSHYFLFKKVLLTVFCPIRTNFFKSIILFKNPCFLTVPQRFPRIFNFIPSHVN